MPRGLLENQVSTVRSLYNEGRLSRQLLDIFDSPEMFKTGDRPENFERWFCSLAAAARARFVGDIEAQIELNSDPELVVAADAELAFA
jgi:hypothetical protein